MMSTVATIPKRKRRMIITSPTIWKPAKEIARQVRLRNISGIIVVDFINLKNKGAKRRTDYLYEVPLKRGLCQGECCGFYPLRPYGDHTRQEISVLAASTFILYAIKYKIST